MPTTLLKYTVDVMAPLITVRPSADVTFKAFQSVLQMSRAGS